MWSELLGGGLVVTEHLRAEAANTIVARQVRRSRGAALTVGQARVAIGRARGTPVKVLALELGVTNGAIARRIAGAMRKLKLRSEAELVALVGSATSFPAAAVAGRGDCDIVLTYRAPCWTLPAYLSAAERLVVREVIAGASHDGVARARGIAPRTVANHLASIYRKMHVHSRIEMFVALAGRPPPATASPPASSELVA
jgi:DNA-binding NarL/FixJ family response regulator